MGCTISKDDNEPESIADCQLKTDDHVELTMNDNMDYKSKLEWKLCIVSYIRSPKIIRYLNPRFIFKAKETPEPEFDLCDCHLSEIPSGVFVLCRVLLKDRLLLQGNHLRSLEGGGKLIDLRRLQTINLSRNELLSLPSDFSLLENLRVIKASSDLLLTIVLIVIAFRLRNYFYRITKSLRCRIICLC